MAISEKMVERMGEDRVICISSLRARVRVAMFMMRDDESIATYVRQNREHMEKIMRIYDIECANDQAICGMYIAHQLERGVYDECARCIISSNDMSGKALYASKIYELADLLRAENCELLRAIICGRASARDIASMSVETLRNCCPSILRAEREEIALRMMQKIEQKTSSLYKCKKCNANKTLVRETQTRSSDEAPTLMIQCVECYHCWTQTG